MIPAVGNAYTSLQKKRFETDIINVMPCAMVVGRESGCFRTIVGSGISVCLFDRLKRIAGMNHFLFPRVQDPLKATGRYGNAALIGLLKLMQQHEPQVLPIAFVAGGAYCDEFEIDSALENIRMAWKFLKIKQIPIISQIVGGCWPREVLFDIENGRFSTNNIRGNGA